MDSEAQAGTPAGLESVAKAGSQMTEAPSPDSTDAAGDDKSTSLEQLQSKTKVSFCLGDVAACLVMSGHLLSCFKFPAQC